jgi:hypothetical protein
VASNPYQRPGFKDPREAALEPASSLSSYFQDKADKKPKTFSPYSAPAESAGGPAPMGGGSAGGPSAPKAAQGGGTGFVSFGQYFGGNAPAVQAQAQKVVQPGSIQPQARTGGAAPKEDPYASQIAQTSARFAALNPAAQSGDMGENVGAFDRLLGGGETQRAAKGEQQRLGTLRAALEGEQATWQKAEERNRQAQEAATQRQAQAQAQQQNLSDATLRSAKERAYREADNSGLTQKFHSRDSWWNSLSDAEKQNYLSAETYADDSEYGSNSSYN